MTGQEHYSTAERLLSRVMLDEYTVESGYESEIAAAQVHATLALAAAQAEQTAHAAKAARTLGMSA